MIAFKLDTSNMETVSFKEGDTLLVEGERTGKVFVLKSGAVKVMTADKEICRVNEPESIFGEISALLDTEHSASVIAVENTECFIVKDLLALSKQNPEAVLHVAQILANRLVHMNHHFLEIRTEVDRLREVGGNKKETGKLAQLMVKMDEFWGSTVF